MPTSSVVVGSSTFQRLLMHSMAERLKSMTPPSGLSSASTWDSQSPAFHRSVAIALTLSVVRSWASSW